MTWGHMNKSYVKKCLFWEGDILYLETTKSYYIILYESENTSASGQMKNINNPGGKVIMKENWRIALILQYNHSTIKIGFKKLLGFGIM